MLVVIDATAVNGGPLARALETAGRTAASCGMEVRTVRLYDTYGHLCSRCMACSRGGRRCTSRADELTALVALMRSADSFLVGAPSRLLGGDPTAKALLVRLVRAFADQPDARCTRPVIAAGTRKRAAVIASCSPPSMVPASIGQMVGTAGKAWRTLTDCGVDVVGTASLLGAWSAPGALDRPLERSAHLGRMLAAPRRGNTPSPVPTHIEHAPRLSSDVPAHSRLARPMGV